MAYCTPDEILQLTGIRPANFSLADDPPGPDAQTAYEKLSAILSAWADNISSAIDARLKNGSVSDTDARYKGIKDVCLRTVAKLVATAMQMRLSPVIRIDDFIMRVLNTSDVTKELSAELRPYQRSTVNVFLSSEAS